MNSRVVTKYETVAVRFDGFEALPATKGRNFVHSEFTRFGHRWSLHVYPGGSMISDDGQVAVFLRHLSTSGNIEVQTRFIVELGTQITACKAHKLCDHCWGAIKFAERAKLIGALEEGSLVIEVLMKQTEPSAPPVPFTPENPFCKIMLKKCMDDTCSDAVFEVGDERVVIHAHRFILEDGAPALFDLCTSGADSATIPITNVQPDVFRHLLRYVYGGIIPIDYLKENAKDIIDAADIYEVVNLKLEAEAVFVVSTIITIDNVIELLLYSHGKNCALLKEAVVDFIVENGADILRQVSLEDVPGALFADLLTAATRGKQDTDESDESDDELSTMRVSDLRKKLHEKGLDIDGSRKAMIALLKASS